VPWCDDCSRFYNPTSMTAAGECPTCGRVIAAPAKAPWHFKAMLVALAGYLALRAWQGVEWILHR
jgi:hypothetical protein